MATSRICSIPDCGKPHDSHGFCGAHAQRFRKHGDPLAGRTPEGALPKFINETVLPYVGDECLIWPFSRTKGYAAMGGKGQTVYVSRLVCEHRNGPPPSPAHQAAHSCGNGHRGCVTPRHLSWKTRKENMADCVGHGTHKRGERHPLVKLNADQVRQIRALRGAMSQTAIGARFGVTQSLVGMIQRRTIWKSLD